MYDGFAGGERLIFDIGAHKGDDTAVYLQLGYKVIAVDANPALVAEMRSRFQEAVISGRLVLLNYAVTNEDFTETSLYIADDDSQSSLVKKTNCPIIVVSRTLGSLIKEFGLPFFCKIDIEGCDERAIESLTKGICPPFVSVELSGSSLDAIQTDTTKLYSNLDLLSNLGYQRFRLVDQATILTLSDESFYRTNLKILRRIKNRIVKMFSRDFRTVFLSKFRLNRNAEISGYPGFVFSRDWVGYEEMKNRIQFHFREYYSVASSTALIFWVDLHATF
jgi:FkbM family methyltransferase